LLLAAHKVLKSIAHVSGLDKRRVHLPSTAVSPSRRPRNMRLFPALQFQVAASPLTFLLDLINAALHVEICFRHFVVFAVENLLKAAHCLCNRHILAFVTGKNFCDVERLAEKPLDFTRTVNSKLVFW